MKTIKHKLAVDGRKVSDAAEEWRKATLYFNAAIDKLLRCVFAGNLIKNPKKEETITDEK